jgi:hypothetical protein
MPCFPGPSRGVDRADPKIEGKSVIMTFELEDIAGSAIRSAQIVITWFA